MLSQNSYCASQLLQLHKLEQTLLQALQNTPALSRQREGQRKGVPPFERVLPERKVALPFDLATGLLNWQFDWV